MRLVQVQSITAERKFTALPEKPMADLLPPPSDPLMIPAFSAFPAMDLALEQAAAAAARGEVPVGAVVVRAADRAVLAACGNRVEELGDPTAHAEVLALRQAASRTGQSRLSDCDLYVTLEPCALCATAISFFRIRRLYFGAYDPKGGGVDHGPRLYHQPTLHHRPDVYGGIAESQCAELLKVFFRKIRYKEIPDF